MNPFFVEMNPLGVAKAFVSLVEEGVYDASPPNEVDKVYAEKLLQYLLETGDELNEVVEEELVLASGKLFTTNISNNMMMFVVFKDISDS